MRQSRMYIPDILVTLGTQDTGRRQTKQTNTTQHRKIKRLTTWTHIKTGGKPRCSWRVSSSWFL